MSAFNAVTSKEPKRLSFYLQLNNQGTSTPKSGIFVYNIGVSDFAILKDMAPEKD